MRTIDIKHCSDCPFNQRIEFGFGGVEYDQCTKTKKEVHPSTFVDGFPPSCPLKSENKS